jgi:hypothetical protein
MATTIPVQITQQGLLIPRAVIQEWVEQGIQAVKDEQSIIIRPKPAHTDARRRVRQVLRAADMLYEPHWETPSPVSVEERADLARRLAQGRPLSEIIIEDRQDRV